MKIISFIGMLLRAPSREPVPEEKLRWMCDPLSHPALEAMSERELADLPLRGRYRGARDCEGNC